MMVKSPDPVDPVRLTVVSADSYITPDYEVSVTVAFRYDPWEPSAAQDALWEQARALDCIREVLKRGGVGSDW